MSGTAPVMALGVGGVELGFGGFMTPFTAMQWQELEQQAMIYKYLVAGLPVPPDLVMPIRHSLEALAARFLHQPALGYCSYYGKKFDPEPGRCRRTDGKKWRCSKDAHSDSKYCERHMHRGRNRSRKPVESQSTSQSMSTAMSSISTGCSSNNGSFLGNASGSFQNMPFYSVSAEGSPFESNVMKLQMEPTAYAINDKDISFSSEASASVGSLGLGSSAGSGTWPLKLTQVSSSSLFKQRSNPQLLGHSSAQQRMAHAFGSTETNFSKPQQQHCFFGSDNGSPGLVKQEQQPVHLFFSEWPSTKESRSNMDDDGSNPNVFSSTQLSISIPSASSDFTSRNPYSTKSDFKILEDG